MNVNVYIDGFNLYYGAIKGTPYRWLDLRAFCERSLPRDDVVQIRYFTALVRPLPNDPDAPLRQSVYLRALRTLSGFSIHEGTHRVRNKPVYLMPSGKRKAQHATAIVSEEKGSDVNLASHLLMDGFRKAYDAAVVISDDADLIEPIRMVRRELGLRVGILNPQIHIEKRTGKRIRRYELEKAVTSGFYRDIDRTLLPQCLLPDPVIDTDGTPLAKPSSW